ncbi:trypsin-like peptidase domain-containing protein [Waterburya agarophytonicola K14]|uniref:Trypsin-like peptidase domain-containing protein n=1 Tax=Waterburya agarophytonicola KI4 TaxID=2874699 RepID=A0A964BQD9_9CYAN|nr:serine protease [Waterburya agarophytonicola]MCC0176417.1 trypsin-like peptidase domain-containing protein [Waterburya agarophytonicola KI4]
MKWLPSRGSQKQNQAGQTASDKNLPKSIPLVIGLTCLISTGAFFSLNRFGLKKIFALNSFQESSPEIKEIAADISIKVLDKEFLGSGFIVQQQGNKYVVITNQHVLRAGEAPYNVQTPDGKIHSAEVISTLVESDRKYDLAVLQFSADVNYPVAKIGSSLYLEVGEPIYAAGFPYSEVGVKNPAERDRENSQTNPLTGLAVKTGRITIILNQALLEGYQIGYTNDVKKGMSGGALLNSQGEVVGVNGKHAYPLWESPELYQDGTQLCSALEKLITRSSLAIPIEKTIELNPQLKSLRPSSNIKTTPKSNLAAEDSKIITTMQQEAESLVRDCQERGINSLDREGKIENEF